MIKPPLRCIRVTIGLLFLLGTALSQSRGQIVEADANLIIRSVAVNSDGERIIEFEDLVGDRSNFSLLAIVDLTSSIGAWSDVQDAAYEEMFPGYHRFTVPATQSYRSFYRVVSGGVTEDFDRDGLTAAEEEALGTSDELADTDGDGFSDFIESENDTDPLDEDEFPSYEVLSIASFRETSLRLTEQSGLVDISIEFDDPNFSGLASFEISSLTNALTSGSNRDFSPAKNVIQIIDGVGTLSLSLVDDEQVENIETIVIDLIRGESGTYRIGSSDRILIQVFDNDSYWTGYMKNEDAGMSFRMLLIESDGDITGMITRPESLEENSISIGTGFPTGDWTLTASKTDDSFHATTQKIPVPESRLMNVSMQRTLVFNASPPPDPDAPRAFYDFRETRIAGIVHERLESTNPGEDYLTRENDFAFVIIKDAPQLEEIEIPFEVAE